jgi:hypothetical protein
VQCICHSCAATVIALSIPQLRAGTGDNLMPASPVDVSWWNATLWQNDGLYKEIAFGPSGLQYFLGHHTFNHEVLNAITY